MAEQFNPLNATGFFLYFLKISENQDYCDVFRECRKRSVAWNGSTRHSISRNLQNRKIKTLSIFTDIRWLGQVNNEFSVIVKRVSRSQLFLVLFFIVIIIILTINFNSFRIFTLTRDRLSWLVLWVLCLLCYISC